jgi:hypothetical protein
MVLAKYFSIKSNGITYSNNIWYVLPMHKTAAEITISVKIDTIRPLHKLEENLLFGTLILVISTIPNSPFIFVESITNHN